MTGEIFRSVLVTTTSAEGCMRRPVREFGGVSGARGPLTPWSKRKGLIMWRFLAWGGVWGHCFFTKHVLSVFWAYSAVNRISTAFVRSITNAGPNRFISVRELLYHVASFGLVKPAMRKASPATRAPPLLMIRRKSHREVQHIGPSTSRLIQQAIA